MLTVQEYSYSKEVWLMQVYKTIWKFVITVVYFLNRRANLLFSAV